MSVAIAGDPRPQVDQATRLRELVSALRKPAAPRGPSRTDAPPRRVPMIAVTSGKGGVGKTSLAVNLSIALAQRGLRTALLDADPGTANADVMLGVSPARRLERLRSGDSLGTLLVEGPGGIGLVPGLAGMAQVAGPLCSEVLTRLGELNRSCDVLVVDTGAGIGPGVTEFVRAADDAVFVVTPEPTSIVDAYALLKTLHRTPGAPAPQTRCSIVVNQVRTRRDADETSGRLVAAAERFLDVPLGTLGSIPWDASVPKAVRERSPVVLSYARRPAARAIGGIAEVVARGLVRAQVAG